MTDQITTPNSSNQQETKEERIDELDVMGTMLFTLIQKSFNKIKQLLGRIKK